eukprot:7565638-Pyramimonas_sp.AAC.1
MHKKGSKANPHKKYPGHGIDEFNSPQQRDALAKASNVGLVPLFMPCLNAAGVHGRRHPRASINLHPRRHRDVGVLARELQIILQTERHADWPGLYFYCQRLVATPAAIWQSS